MKDLLRNLLAGFLRQLPRLTVAAIAFAWCVQGIAVLAPPGWDEATHAGFPAVDLWDRLSHGELAGFAHAALRLEQYPPVYPAMLSGLFLLSGPSVLAARALGAALFALLSVCAGALADHAVGSRETTRAGWVAQGLVLLSPLLVHYGRTLFLEVPFAALCAFGALLYVKLERRELEHLPPGRPRGTALYLLPGAVFAAAVFTKWNYGAVLLAILAVERLCALALRTREAGRSLRASAALFAPVLVLALWWFLAPLPGSPGEVGAAHRAAFEAYLAGVRAEGIHAAALALYGGWFLHLSPFVLACVLALAPLALRYLPHPGVRFLALAAAGFLGAVLWHPFKLERFLIPGLIFLWILAGCGFHLATRQASSPARAWLLLAAAFVALVSAARGLLPPERLGLAPVPEEVLRSWRDPYASRWVPVPGPTGVVELARRIAVELPRGGGLRVVRTGHELPDATLLWHLLLASRDGPGGLDRTLARREREDQLDVARFGLDPGWEPAQREKHLAEFLAGADLLVILDPGYSRGRGFRGESAVSAELCAALAERARNAAAFEPAGPAFELAFSERHPIVRVELYRRIASTR